MIERGRTKRCVLSADKTNRLLMYYNAVTMTIMVIITFCSLSEKQDDLYDQS
jgi:hypothetical protein